MFKKASMENDFYYYPFKLYIKDDFFIKEFEKIFLEIQEDSKKKENNDSFSDPFLFIFFFLFYFLILKVFFFMMKSL